MWLNSFTHNYNKSVFHSTIKQNTICCKPLSKVPFTLNSLSTLFRQIISDRTVDHMILITLLFKKRLLKH